MKSNDDVWRWHFLLASRSFHRTQNREKYKQRSERERGEMSVSTASYLVRRATQKERVRILYRRALKDTLNWAVHRHLFYHDVIVLLSLAIAIG